MGKIAEIQKILGVTADGIFGPKSRAALDAAIAAEIPKPNADVADRVDARSEANIATLHRRVQPLARQLVQLAQANGLDAKVLSGTRTYAEQDALFRQGGVTKARGGYSNHNFGLAFDLGIFIDGKYIDEEADRGGFPRAKMDALYRKLGGIGKDIGLAWGGDWKGFVDMPHFQLEPAWAEGMEEKQMLAELRRRHDNGIDPFG